MAITFKQLRAFVAVAHETTLTAASERLFLTKPAVSLALAELERQCGQRLFDRHNNRLYLNEQGRRMLPLADELLQRGDDLEQLFTHQQALTGQLRIGASYTIGHQVLPYLLRDFRRDSGHRQQQVTIANSTAICTALERFELDIGMIEGRTEHDALMITPWCVDRMLIAAAHDHPLAGLGRIPLDALDHQEWVLREQGSGTREQFMRFVAPRLEHWHVTLEFNSAEAIINATAAGLGLTCVSELEAHHALRDGRLVEIDVPLVMRRRFSLVTHKEKYQSPLMQRFLAFCLDQPIGDQRG
ncbi:LysR family transcriptional regulator [Phytohalomonas tamaricis]|uniref:LysR family transcriptional regulator n=1 Tax=Phytohalomonas tamaricis TaxID=2081032 RepID=UPI000D0B3555|nr:LysR family transcriptional regulator [Phytohalomonas tamaricis]